MATFIICGGGPENPLHIQNWSLAEALAAAGHQVTYVVDGNRTELVGRKNGYSVQTWPAWSLGHWRGLLFIFSLIRQQKPDAVLANFFSVYLTMPVALLCRVRVRIAWYRDLSDQWRLNLKRSFLRKMAANLIRRFAYACATQVVPVSKVAQADVCRTLGVPAVKCRVFHSCRPTPTVVWQGESLAHSEEKKILHVGQLWPSKGQDILLRALKILVDLEPNMNVRVEFLGDGPNRADYECLAHELGVEHQVVFAGRIAHGEVAQRMAAAHLLALPYRTDAGPGVIPEGLGVGIPVVVAAAGAMPELLGETQAVCFVPPDDPAALARALREVLNDPKRRQFMSEAGRELFWKKFHLSSWLEGVQQWLEQIIVGTRAKRE